ncbi:Imm8 family immunity protein [Candidatus Dependentiae bacterium]
MKKQKLQSFFVLSDLGNLEVFNDKVNIYIGKKDSEASNLFFLNIISLKWIESIFQDKSEAYKRSIYLRYTLILKKYDEEIIKKHLEKIIKKCNNESNEDEQFKCLSHYLEYETEEWIY